MASPAVKDDNRRGYDWVGQYNFEVQLEGKTAGHFKAVSGLSTECEPIEYMNGTDGTMRKRPGRIKVSNVTLKRGWANDGHTVLWDWWETVLKGKVQRKSGSIILHNDRGAEVARYNFTEAWPCKWKGWDLDAQGNGTVIEEIELCCETIVRKMGAK